MTNQPMQESELEQWWVKVCSEAPMEVRLSSSWDHHARYYTQRLAALLAQEYSRGAKDFITGGWGERCKIRDTEDFPELKDEVSGRCACCEMWEHYDEWVAVLEKGEEAESPSLQRYLDTAGYKNDPTKKGMAREAVRQELSSLALRGGEFGRQSGNIEAGWAHIRDLIQKRLKELEEKNG